MTVLQDKNIASRFLEFSNKRNAYSALQIQGTKFLNEIGFPTKTEEYKYTALTKKIEQNISNFSIAQRGILTAEVVQKHIFSDFEGDVIVLNNGYFEPSLSQIHQKNIEIHSLLSQEFELLGSLVQHSKDPFVALNNAIFQDGVYIKVGKKENVEKPILILKFQDASVYSSIHQRVFLEVGGQSSVEVMEYNVHFGENPYFSTDVTEIKVGANAQVQHERLQDENQLIGFTHLEVDVHKDAVFTSVVLSLSADMLRNNLHLNLKESGTTGNMYGLYLLNKNSHVDNHTQVDHLKPHCESNELYKGIIDDQARGVFNGKIFVRQDAQKTNAFQQNNNILLSEDAIINTKPQLEIWADDVKCSHGCTTGQLDEEALFYLQSRGIGKSTAKALLLDGVTAEIVEHIKNEAFQKYCTAFIQKRLNSKSVS
jgi:Fe-S cluster assembly protein SufD